MTSLLLLTADPAVVDRLQAAGERLNLRLRHVTAPNAAREWLAMQSFDVLVVDSRYGDSVPLEVLSFAWKHHPLLIGAVFDAPALTGMPAADPWTAHALGAHVFSGSEAYRDLEAFLAALPESFEIGQTARTAVLVVEDIDSPRDIICAYIEALGYPQVQGAGSGEQALQYLETDPYAYFCVISDILMPKMNGIELTRRIRANSDRAIALLPVIMLTAVPTTEHLVEALEAGASGFLVKPPKKIALKKELEKAKRLIMTRRSPRLCQEKDAFLLQAALRKLGIG